jgi:hypothetical protein
MKSKSKSKQRAAKNNGINLIIDPPETMDLLLHDKKKQNVVLFKFEPDLISAKTLRIDLNVAFRPVPIKREEQKRIYFQVGCTGALISLRADNAAIKDYTPDTTLDVKYTNTVTRKRNFAMSLSPAIKTENGADKAELSIGSVTREAGEDRTFTSAFKNTERDLVAIDLHDGIEWILDMPKGNMVIRDYLTGHLHLFAEFKCNNLVKSGIIAIRPKNVQFYSGKNAALGDLRSFIMEYVLWRKEIKGINRDGTKIKFKEIRR